MADLRLFWALNLPVELKAELGRFQLELKKLSPDAKWVEQENLHLTVKFLGTVDSAGLPLLIRAVSEDVRDITPFRLELRGSGTFGRPPRVLWSGVGGDVEALRDLHDRVERALAPLGFPAEAKVFSPHLTLARFRSTRNLDALRGRAAALAAGRGSWGAFTADRVDLMQSILTRHGPIYRVVTSVDFAGGHGADTGQRPAGR